MSPVGLPSGALPAVLALLATIAWAAAFDAHAASPFGQDAASREMQRTQRTSPVEVRVVSYNVHGLPGWIARDDPAARMPRIAAALARYDVALVQEDWAHHDVLAAAARGFHVERGNGARPTLLAVFPSLCGHCGSGLSLLVRSPPQRVAAVERAPFGVCSGWIFGANDCWATKGLLRARVAFENGAEVDFYDVHLDAGSGAADLAARRIQLQVLREHVERSSGDHAIVLGGDWNLSLQSAPDAAALEAFRAGLRLEDAGARNRLEPPWTQQIDHVLFRSGREVRLERLEAGEALELSPAGAPLSDHPGVYVRFRVSASPAPD